jgi:hypothetical protein
MFHDMSEYEGTWTLCFTIGQTERQTKIWAQGIMNFKHLRTNSLQCAPSIFLKFKSGYEGGKRPVVHRRGRESTLKRVAHHQASLARASDPSVGDPGRRWQAEAEQFF